jgi:hypothetical protein
MQLKGFECATCGAYHIISSKHHFNLLKTIHMQISYENTIGLKLSISFLCIKYHKVLSE